jgi:diguanylate cyclase
MDVHWRPLWIAGLAGGLLACLSLLVIPVESTTWVLVARGTSLVALGVFLATNLRLPPSTRRIWWAVWLYEALTVTADIVFDIQQRYVGEPPFPGPADAFYLAAYVFAFVALLLLVRGVHPGRDREAWIDTTIVTIAAASVVGVFVAAPTIADSATTDVGTAIALLYPLLDIIVLSGLIRLLVGGRRANPALALLVTAFGLTLAADLVYNLLTSNGLDDLSPAWLDALFLASLVVMTAAASAPGATTINAPVVRSAQARATSSSLWLSVGVLAIPVILLFVTWNEGEVAARVLTVASILVILLVLWRLRRLLATVQDQAAQLTSQARTDGLTGIANRRTLDYEMERLDSTTLWPRPSLTIAMLDLDHFKDYNDRFGHRAGDDLLIHTARAWRDALGGEGFIARYGGEEFTILLPGIDLVGSRSIIEAVRLATPDGMTVSVGVAERASDETGFQALQRADRALYRAKEAGRDRVVADSRALGEPRT